MDAVLGDYVAEKVIDDFRADRQFSESVLRSIRVFPLIDQIRSRIDPRDSERVLSLLRSPSITVFRFGLSLARRIQHLPEIRDALQRSWGSSRDPQIREAVIWALTQYPETTRAEHAAFFEFFRENPAVFLDELETWFGGRQNIVSGCRARLDDPSFESKRWMYLWCLAFSPERTEARKVVAAYINDGDALTARVAREAIAEIDQGAPMA